MRINDGATVGWMRLNIKRCSRKFTYDFSTDAFDQMPYIVSDDFLLS